MSESPEHEVGLRDLRHHTRDVLARVQRGEVLDITDYGRPVARLVPIEGRDPQPILVALVDAGRVRLATRPGFRPRMRAGDGTDRLTNALRELRDDERW